MIRSLLSTKLSRSKTMVGRWSAVPGEPAISYPGRLCTSKEFLLRALLMTMPGIPADVDESHVLVCWTRPSPTPTLALPVADPAVEYSVDTESEDDERVLLAPLSSCTDGVDVVDMKLPSGDGALSLPYLPLACPLMLP